MLVLLGAVVSTKAQEIVSSSGNCQETSSGSLSWTIGEPVTETAVNGNIVTQGFQQSRMSVTGLSDIENETVRILIFPNPAKESITVEAPNLFFVNLYNLDGKLLLKERSDNTKIKINMTPYASGIYLLKITDNTEINTYQIIKQ